MFKSRSDPERPTWNGKNEQRRGWIPQLFKKSKDFQATGGSSWTTGNRSDWKRRKSPAGPGLTRIHWKRQRIGARCRTETKKIDFNKSWITSMWSKCWRETKTRKKEYEWIKTTASSVAELSFDVTQSDGGSRNDGRNHTPGPRPHPAWGTAPEEAEACERPVTHLRAGAPRLHPGINTVSFRFIQNRQHRKTRK